MVLIFACSENWAWGDAQVRSLKAESRGCLGGLISSLGEVRPPPYLSQTRVVLLERLLLLLGRRSKGQNILKTARAARRGRRARGRALVEATGTGLSGRSRSTS